MIYKKFNNKYIVRLNVGEDIVESVKKFAQEENIRFGTVTGIGAINKAKIGLFNTETKEYQSTILEEDMEIISLAGNITEMNGEPYIHLHIALANSEHNVKAGHLNMAVISATGEIIIEAIDGYVDREFDDDIGLNLLKF
jgi:hypothetical protein